MHFAQSPRTVIRYFQRLTLYTNLGLRLSNQLEEVDFPPSISNEKKYHKDESNREMFAKKVGLWSAALSSLPLKYFC